MTKRVKSKPPTSNTWLPHVALLRGINVGGKNKLAMADLAAILCEAGCRDVQTYIQSGNVVFAADAKTAGQVTSFVSNKIAERFGMRIPVVLRTVDEFREAVRRNPFLAPGVELDSLLVGFLADKPSRRLVAALDPDRSPGDSFQVAGRHVYLRLVNGAAKTKLTNVYFDSALSTTSTFRNWRTTQKLLEIMQTKN